MDAGLRELARGWERSRSLEDARRYLSALARTASPEAEYLRERVRVGELNQDRLRLAAYVGHETASQALGAGAAAAPRDLEGCLRGLGEWGVDVALRGFLTAFQASWLARPERPAEELLGLLATARAALAGDPDARVVLLDPDGIPLPPQVLATPAAYPVRAAARAVRELLRGNGEQVCMALPDLLLLLGVSGADQERLLALIADDLAAFALEGDRTHEPLRAAPPSIRALGLSAPVEGCLRRAGLLRLEDVLARSREELLEIEGIGPARAREVLRAAARHRARTGRRASQG